jgi:hypothetical protein
MDEDSKLGRKEGKRGWDRGRKEGETYMKQEGWSVRNEGGRPGSAGPSQIPNLYQ